MFKTMPSLKTRILYNSWILRHETRKLTCVTMKFKINTCLGFLKLPNHSKSLSTLVATISHRIFKIYNKNAPKYSQNHRGDEETLRMLGSAGPLSSHPWINIKERKSPPPSGLTSKITQVGGCHELDPAIKTIGVKENNRKELRKTRDEDWQWSGAKWQRKRKFHKLPRGAAEFGFYAGRQRREREEGEREWGVLALYRHGLWALPLKVLGFAKNGGFLDLGWLRAKNKIFLKSNYLSSKAEARNDLRSWKKTQLLQKWQTMSLVLANLRNEGFQDIKRTQVEQKVGPHHSMYLGLQKQRLSGPQGTFGQGKKFLEIKLSFQRVDARNNWRSRYKNDD